MADLNVWIAIASAAHARHTRAREWFHSLGPDQVWFCRFTQMGLLRLLTNSAVMAGKPLTQVQAWAVFDQFAANARVGYLDEPPGVTEAFRTFTYRGEPATQTWNDSYIGAVAMQAGMSVATFDRGFAESGLPALIL